MVSGKEYFQFYSVVSQKIGPNYPQITLKSVLIFIRLRGISDAQWERFLLVSQKMAPKYPQIA